MQVNNTVPSGNTVVLSAVRLMITGTALPLITSIAIVAASEAPYPSTTVQEIKSIPVVRGATQVASLPSDVNVPLAHV